VVDTTPPLRQIGKAARRLKAIAQRLCALLRRWQLYYGWGPRLMSELRRRWILFTHPHANIIFEGPVHIAPGFSLYMPGSATLIVGPHVEFRKGFRAEIVGDCTVRIGPGCIFSYYSLIQTHSDVTIGARCGFGQSFALFDGKHRFRDPNSPFLDQGFDFHPVSIGDDCAVLTKTTVLADIGDHAVIGANSVVTRPIPAYTLAAGIPAKVIDYFGPESHTAMQQPPGGSRH
jgi:acetyltransferase-like isoleucine patch superfamily enzyme